MKTKLLIAAAAIGAVALFGACRHAGTCHKDGKPAATQSQPTEPPVSK